MPNVNPSIQNNLFWLKVLAVVAMFFDHFVVGFVPSDADGWRMFGRLSIPIFCFLIAFGFVFYSTDKIKFAVRLWLFAAVSEPLYIYYFGQSGNAFFPLALGVTLLCAFENRVVHIVWLSLIGVVSVLFFAVVLNSAVLISTVVLILLFYAFFVTDRAVYFALAFFDSFFLNSLHWQFICMVLVSFVLLLIAFSRPVFISSFRVNKWAFYVFYPLHLVFLSLLKVVHV